MGLGFFLIKDRASVFKILLSLVIALQTTGTVHAQSISVYVKDQSLEAVLQKIKMQAPEYSFFYDRENFRHTHPVSLALYRVTLDSALRVLLPGQGLQYTKIENTIFIKIKDDTVAFAHQYHPQGLPITEPHGPDIIRFSSGLLDEVVVSAYGATTRRMNTGNVTKVSNQEIAVEPVFNPLQALEGRVPGLSVTQDNGIPGGYFTVVLRGTHSIAQGTQPLFIIDGVPYAPENHSLSVSTLGTIFGNDGQSPFSVINPADIESVTVLQDAVATAIYGSRGANGVILITSKKGRPGKTNIAINLSRGTSTITRRMNLMNTPEYLSMRREAFHNDGITPMPTNAPDLLTWDTTRYTDFPKLLTGGVAHSTELQASMSRTNGNTMYLFTATVCHTNTVFPGDAADDRFSGHVHIHHGSEDGHFIAEFSALYTLNKARLPLFDLTPYQYAAPTLPRLYDSSGKLNWQADNVHFTNPLSFAGDKYSSDAGNLLADCQLSYQLPIGFTIRVNIGGNMVHNAETSIMPVAAQDPGLRVSGSLFSGDNSYHSWILEPQAEYQCIAGKGRLNLLVGNSWQAQTHRCFGVTRTGYTNDALLSVPGIDTGAYLLDTNTNYHYVAFFGRLNYILKEKYVLDLSGRRDGSSRFGPGKKFGNFGAVGAAWLFTREHFFRSQDSVLSSGKLRVSYGITGNDQIRDGAYLEDWGGSSLQTYQNIRVVYPTTLSNSRLAWEMNKKFETGMELGLIRDKLLLSLVYFLDRSGNQLLQNGMALQTGFSTVLQNLPVVVENKGWELSLQAQPVVTSTFKWGATMMLTVPHNRLIDFPGLSTSYYGGVLIEGQSLSVLQTKRYTGVDPGTGLFSIDPSSTVFVNTDPRYYGSIGNNFEYKKWQLSVFVVFRKQSGLNYLVPIFRSAAPGMDIEGHFNNQPVEVLDRWRNGGDQAAFQRYTASPASAAVNAIGLLSGSSDYVTDASYIRLKAISFSYNFRVDMQKGGRPLSCRLYMQGQNLFTITHYKGTDPESQNPMSLPPLKTLTAGIQLTLK